MTSPLEHFPHVEVYLGLGANTGNPAETLPEAFRLIENDILTNARLSSLYVTEPQDVKKQPDFINAVCTGFFSGSALELLAAVHKIEKRLGRNRETEFRRGPRAIDIDILYFGGIQINHGTETEGEGNWIRIPHARLKQRRFALEPLLELSPDLIDPETSRPYSFFNDLLFDQGIYTFDAVSYIKPHGAES